MKGNGNPGRCPVCGSEMYGWAQAPAADPGRDEEFILDGCADCGLGVIRGGGPPAADLYETGSYTPGRPRMERLLAPLLSGFDRARMRIIRSAVEPGARVLEVGAGRGRFLARLAAAGYEVRGIEPAGHRRREAEELGVRVDEATIETAEVEEGSQDAVLAWHVLEHLDDPGAALDRIRRWLRPGGALVIGVPNRRSVQAELGGSHWFHLDLPRHRWHFTPRSLELLLRTHGFEAERARHLMLEHNQLGMWQTAMNSITFHDNFLFGVLKRSLTWRTAESRPKFVLDAFITLAAGIPSAALTIPAEAISGLLRRGGTIAVVARSG